MRQRALDHQRSSSYFYMPLTCILVMISVIFCGGVSKERALRVFGNMTYHVPYGLEKTEFTLIDGEYSTWENQVYYDNRYVYDDFNHDGLKDAAVMITTNTGGGGNQDWYVLAFLINDGKKLAHRASINLDDRAEIYALHAKEGKVLVDMHVHQPGDCNGGPSKHLREWYEYPGPSIFTKRAGSYIWGESVKGVKGMSDKGFKAQFIPQLGYNHGFISGAINEYE